MPLSVMAFIRPYQDGFAVLVGCFGSVKWFLISDGSGSCESGKGEVRLILILD